jgi:hypothetical protein
MKRTKNHAGERVLRVGQSTGGLIGVILVIVIAAAIGLVGVKILSEFQDNITDTDLSSTDAANQTQYENATESVSQGFTDAMSLSDIVFLVLMFGVILIALLGFSRTGGGGGFNFG